MNVAERVEQLHAGLVAMGVIPKGQPLDVVALYCNGCGRMAIVQRRPGESEGGFLARAEETADGWSLGGIHEERDFCSSCSGTA